MLLLDFRIWKVEKLSSFQIMALPEEYINSLLTLGPSLIHGRVSSLTFDQKAYTFKMVWPTETIIALITLFVACVPLLIKLWFYVKQKLRRRMPGTGEVYNNSYPSLVLPRLTIF